MNIARYCEFLELEIARLECENINLQNQLKEKYNVPASQVLQDNTEPKIKVRGVSENAKKAAQEVLRRLEKGDKTRLQLTNLMKDYNIGVVKNALDWLRVEGKVSRYLNPNFKKEYVYSLPEPKLQPDFF